jgi:hypothetical protein
MRGDASRSLRLENGSGAARVSPKAHTHRPTKKSCERTWSDRAMWHRAPMLDWPIREQDAWRRSPTTRKRIAGGVRSEEKMESADKPGSVVDSHSSRTRVTARFKRPTRERCGPHRCSPIWSCSRRGLPCRRCYHRRGALLPHLFTLTPLLSLDTSRPAGRRLRCIAPDSHGMYPGIGERRSVFCGTFRQLTLPRRYLAPCPREPGLSSRSLSYGQGRATVWPTPNIKIQESEAKIYTAPTAFTPVARVGRHADTAHSSSRR